MNYIINNQIKQELQNRGFKVTASNTRKSVLKFEELKISNDILKELRTKPFIWILLNLISREKPPLTCDQIQQIIFNNKEHLKTIMNSSPDKNILCNRCSEVIYRYNIDFDDKLNTVIKCQKCNAPNNLNSCKEENDWSFPSLSSYLEHMAKIGILIPSILGSCPHYCTSVNIIPYDFKQVSTKKCSDLRKFVSNLYCDKCGSFLELGNIYDVSDSIHSIWIRENIWMEWYIKNIIKMNLNTDLVEQGLTISNHGSTQTDVLLLKNDKIISYECKNIGLTKNINFEEVSDVLNYLDFSDEVFLVIPTKLTENDKIRLLNRGNNKLKIIECLDVDQLVKYLD